MGNHPIFQAVQSLIEKGDATTLQLSFGSREVKPGEKIPKKDARTDPTLRWKAASPGQKYLVVSLDLDAPLPSFAFLSPILHWLQHGLASTSTSDGDGPLVSSDPAITFWGPPGPPPISSPHRYIFFLYEQPAGFEPQPFTKPDGYGIKDRIKWDLAKFEKEAKLGPALAATYFSSN